jgi:cyanuric acid amidohydrolase
MTSVDIIKAPTNDPGDTSPVETVKAAGYSTARVIAIVGKTEGNGCVNDFSRTLSAAVWEPSLPADAVTVFSGGTEGVLTPHVSFVVADDTPHPGFDRGLVAAAGRTRTFAPQEIGRRTQAREVRDTVAGLMAALELAPEDVHLVLVKCPLLTSAKVAACRAMGAEPATSDTYESMAHSRRASSIGIALALGECAEDEVEPALAGTAEVWSSRASASSGAELDDCHVLVLGTSTRAANPLRAVHASMRDAIDVETVNGLLDQVRAQDGTVVQVFAKAEADPSGTLRGQRHTMLTDSDLQSTRHARAAVGGLLAGLVQDTAIYVSGGAESQGPPGGGSLVIVYRLPQP